MLEKLHLFTYALAFKVSLFICGLYRNGLPEEQERKTQRSVRQSALIALNFLHDTCESLVLDPGTTVSYHSNCPVLFVKC